MPTVSTAPLQEGSTFTEKELSDLTFALAAINAWNRLAITSRTVPGGYTLP